MIEISPTRVSLELPALEYETKGVGGRLPREVLDYSLRILGREATYTRTLTHTRAEHKQDLICIL